VAIISRWFEAEIDAASRLASRTHTHGSRLSSWLLLFCCVDWLLVYLAATHWFDEAVAIDPPFSGNLFFFFLSFCVAFLIYLLYSPSPFSLRFFSFLFFFFFFFFFFLFLLVIFPIYPLRQKNTQQNTPKKKSKKMIWLFSNLTKKNGENNQVGRVGRVGRRVGGGEKGEENIHVYLYPFQFSPETQQCLTMPARKTLFENSWELCWFDPLSNARDTLAIEIFQLENMTNTFPWILDPFRICAFACPISSTWIKLTSSSFRHRSERSGVTNLLNLDSAFSFNSSPKNPFNYDNSKIQLQFPLPFRKWRLMACGFRRPACPRARFKVDRDLICINHCYPSIYFKDSCCRITVGCNNNIQEGVCVCVCVCGWPQINISDV